MKKFCHSSRRINEIFKDSSLHSAGLRAVIFNSYILFPSISRFLCVVPECRHVPEINLTPLDQFCSLIQFNRNGSKARQIVSGERWGGRRLAGEAAREV